MTITHIVFYTRKCEATLVYQILEAEKFYVNSLQKRLDTKLVNFDKVNQFCKLFNH